MGIFFEDDPSKHYPKPKIIKVIQTLIVVSMIVCILLSFTQQFNPKYIGVSCMLLCVMLGIDVMYYYKTTGNWENKTLLTIVLFLLSGLLLLLT